MRKWMIVTAIFLWVAGVAQVDATTITMNDESPRLWGTLTVNYGSHTDWRVGAGRFSTTVDDGEKHIDTYSYCVDIEKTFVWGESYEAAVAPWTTPLRQAAWLVSQYDPFIGDHWKDNANLLGAQSVAMTLQVAIWEALYGNAFTGVSGYDNGLFTLMGRELASAKIDAFNPAGFFVADISGQDQLVAAPVPEPGTMLLMGMGLLGLGVVGRRRLK